MTSSRPPSRRTWPGLLGVPRAGRARSRPLAAALAAHFRLTVVASLCMLAAGALLVPGLVFGAENPPVSAGVVSNAVTSPSATAPNVPLAVPDAKPAPGEGAEPVPAGGALLVTLPWGAGDRQVGLCRPTEGLMRGPEGLAVAPDGRIAVLDSVNRRLLLLDSGGSVTGSISVALTEPRFLAVDDDRLYVLDCDADRRLATFDWSGASIDLVSIPPLQDVVTGLFATVEGPCVEVAHRTSFLISGAVSTSLATGAAAGSPMAQAVASLGRPAQASLRSLEGRPVDRALGRLARVTFKPGENPRINSFTVDRTNLRSAKTGESTPSIASGRTIEHLVSVDGDGEGGLIVGARLREPAMSEGRQAYLVLTRLAASGTGSPGIPSMSPAESATAVLFLAESSFAYLGPPYVVAPDGRVFQPVGSDAGYSIYVRSFSEGATTTTNQEVQP